MRDQAVHLRAVVDDQERPGLVIAGRRRETARLDHPAQKGIGHGVLLEEPVAPAIVDDLFDRGHALDAVHRGRVGIAVLRMEEHGLEEALAHVVETVLGDGSLFTDSHTIAAAFAFLRVDGELRVGPDVRECGKIGFAHMLQDHQLLPLFGNNPLQTLSSMCMHIAASPAPMKPPPFSARAMRAPSTWRLPASFRN